MVARMNQEGAQQVVRHITVTGRQRRVEAGAGGGGVQKRERRAATSE